MAELSGEKIFQADYDKWLGEAMHRRNEMLESLSRATSGEAWFIVSAPRLQDRRRWKELLKPKEMIIIAPTADECMRRINLDKRRNPERSIEGSYNWWRQYSRDLETETILENR